MNILVVAATEMEIFPYLHEHPSADFLVSGIGSAATVYHLLKRLQQIDYGLVIQAGIAGAFHEGIALGETVVVAKDAFGDLAVSDQGLISTFFEQQLSEPNDFPFDNGWLPNSGMKSISHGLKEVSAITVNLVTDNRDHIAALQLKYGPDIESMEGAAFHYTCLLERIPFLQLRTVSNYVGERDKSKWELRHAIEGLNRELSRIVKNVELTNVNP